MPEIRQAWKHLQRQLFPALQEELGELTQKDRPFVQVLRLLPPGQFPEPSRGPGVGCPPQPRAWIVPAFMAKAVYPLPTTQALLDRLRSRPVLRRLCGGETGSDIPSESTFSPDPRGPA